MSEIEAPARPRSLNRRLAPSSSRERIRRPAERVARAACLGSSGGISGADWTDLGAILPPISYLYDIQTNKSRSGIQDRLCPCLGAQNPYKPRIRGSRPGAERTV